MNIDKFIDQVICGDCLEVMREMPNKCIDIVLTDPPYNVGKYYEKKDGSQIFNDNLPELEYWHKYENWAMEIVRLMKDRSFLYVSSTTKQMFKIKEIFENYGLTWAQVLIWYGANKVGRKGARNYAMPWTQLYEPISMFVKGKRQKMLDGGPEVLTHDVFNIARPQRNYKTGRFHVCQKPLKLYNRIIARTPGEIILDPFAGSGTTALAAHCFGRNYIVIEISDGYCEIIKKRIMAQNVRLYKIDQGEIL